MKSSLMVWTGVLALAATAVVACGGGDSFEQSNTGGAAGAGAGGTASGGAAGSSSGGTGGAQTGGSGGTATGGAAGNAGAGGTAGASCVDADNDGQTTCQGDCNDNDPQIFNGAKEVCGDGVDNDCNNAVDDGCNGLGTFVSSNVGSDSNPGTKASPVATIKEGLNKADQVRQALGTPQAKIDVFVGQGHYSEKVTLVEGVSLLGGYQCDSSSCTWARDFSTYDSAILDTDFEGVLAQAAITRATKLEGLRIQGKDGAPPSGTFGATALMLDGGRPTVANCVINGPATTGTGWPQGRSFAVFIADSADTQGALIMANTITGGSSDTGALGIAFQNLPGATKTSFAEVFSNTITGGAGKTGSTGVSMGNSGTTTYVRSNTINGGISAAAGSWGIAVAGQGTIEANKINLPGTPAKCSAQGRCGGLLSESSTSTIVNNVVFGADAPQSTGVFLGEFEKAAGAVTLNANYIDGGGNSSGGSRSAGVQLEMGTCGACVNGNVGSIRNNIIAPGTATNRFGVLEASPAGKTMHPVALENNFFYVPSVGWTHYAVWNGSSFQNQTTLAAVNGLTVGGMLSGANLDGDPLVSSSYHLQSNSPCIDKGTTTEAPAKDMDGQNRPLGGGIDIGPDERQ